MIVTRTALLIAHDDAREAPGPMAPVRGLPARIALVLGTYREGSDGLVLDHPLWLSTMQALNQALEATRCEVLTVVPRTGWRRWWGHRAIKATATLDELARQLAAAPLSRDPDDQGPDAGNDDIDWEQLRWYRGEDLIAVAQVEPWYAVGGEAPFHDSYTTRLYLDAGQREAAVKAIAQTLQKTEDLRWELKP